jgi:hypothetical protein
MGRDSLVIDLKRFVVPSILLLVIISSGFTLLVFASPSVQQATTTTTTPACPTYEINFIVDLVNSAPLNAAVGDTVVTQVHVVYEDGTPVTLSPELLSFLWTGSSGQKEFDNVSVVYTGTPGLYNYSQTITADLLQSTGQGKVTIGVVSCSGLDVNMNRGPISYTDSDLTLTPSDDSNLNVGVPPSPNPFAQLATLVVPLVIILLLILALILFLRRGRGKKK